MSLLCVIMRCDSHPGEGLAEIRSAACTEVGLDRPAEAISAVFFRVFV
jgi:hypothetical protein